MYRGCNRGCNRGIKSKRRKDEQSASRTLVTEESIEHSLGEIDQRKEHEKFRKNTTN